MFSRLSIFWRLTLGYLTILALVVGVNLYILNQFRAITELGAELATHHFPAVETAKRLITSLFAQLKSDKQYLVLRDTTLLKDFLQEAENFRKTLKALQEQEQPGITLESLEKTKRLHEEFHTLFLSVGVEQADRSVQSIATYEQQRDALITAMTQAITAYITSQEASVGGILRDSHLRSVQAQEITQQLLLMALVLGLGLAGIASYSILRPLRRVKAQIRRIGQGQFGGTISLSVPQELRELVGQVNWMGEKLQKLDEMKSEFLANISHELRTPLTSIREGSQLLLDGIPGTLTKDQRETLIIISESSQRLNHLIGNLLDLSRMEADMVSYNYGPTDLNRLAVRSSEKVKFLADRKNIHIALDLAQDKARLQDLDGARMEQVLENLLTNAIKFSSEGSTILIRSRPDSSGDGVQFTVSDTGPGIPEEDLPHIFERFYQGKTQVGRVFVGSGIGLALAKRVVEAHEGKIWAESILGTGTALHFIIPKRKRDRKNPLKSDRIYQLTLGFFVPLMVVGLLEWGGGSGAHWNSPAFAQVDTLSSSNISSVLTPAPEDIPFFHAIAQDQEKKLSSCKNEDECRAVHFLRGVAALYENRELAALHFRKVVASRPNSALAGESRFWLWLLDVLNAPGGGKGTSQDFTKRLVRELVEKELLVHELSVN